MVLLLHVLIALLTHTVESMVEQHNLSPPPLPDLHQDVARVGVTVDVATEKYHLAVHLTQLQRDLWRGREVLDSGAPTSWAYSYTTAS